MSIRNRVEEAVILQGLGRTEGAFLSALIAFAASSRKRFERDDVRTDKDAFVGFFNENLFHIFSQGILPTVSCFDPTDSKWKELPYSEALYSFARCELVHEGRLRPNFELKNAPNVISVEYRATDAKFIFSDCWISRLLRTVIFWNKGLDEFKYERETGKIVVNCKIDNNREMQIIHSLVCIGCERF